MRVSAEAMRVYEQTNALWKEAGIPTNKYSVVLPSDAHACPETAKRFVVWSLEKHRCLPPLRFKTGSGNRDNWMRDRVWTVNPEKGWFDVVHLTSHWIWRAKRGRLRRLGHKVPRAHHCLDHAHLELYLSQVALRDFITPA